MTNDVQTAYLFDERCMWYSQGEYALNRPVEGFIEPSVELTNADTSSTKRRINNLIHYSGLIEYLLEPQIIPVTEEDIRKVHTKAYINDLKQLSKTGAKIALNTSLSKGGYDIAVASASLAKSAFHTVLTKASKNAYALTRPPGHHALFDEAMGFCFLSNIGIGIKYAKAHFGIEKIAVIDWDVHHGNGTEAIFYEDSSVLAISLHEQDLFPHNSGKVEHRGENKGFGYNINIPVQIGSGEGAYLYAFEKIINPALERFAPDLIVIACGFDASAFDPLGHCVLSSHSYRAMTQQVKQMANRLCDDRLIFCHEGGYSIPYVPFCGQATIEALSDQKTAVTDPFVINNFWASDKLEYWQKEHIDKIAAYLGY